MRVLVEFLGEPLFQRHLVAVLVIRANEAPDDRNHLRCAGCISESNVAEQIGLPLLLVFFEELLYRGIRGRKYV
ncbi:hypothetical protein PPS11_17376 [Pseudomonas putida S11]|nr:hypothetical protein PPS11_17376 [Pseudomonas putida S11]